MADPAKRRAIYQDVVDAPPHRVAEIVDGELVVSPRPAPRHAHASASLGGLLFDPFARGRGGPGGWWILDEPEIHLTPGEPLVPDLAGWRKSRMPALPETAFFEIVPDWVCEILSPTTAALDRVRKMSIYARGGVPHAWLIDPILRTLEVFRREGDGWFVAGTYEGTALVRAEPFDAIDLDLGALWATTPPASP